MARVGIIGGGAFGTAMACVLSRSGHEIVVYAREPEVVESINRDRVNAMFLAGATIPRGIVATGDLAAASARQDFILMVVAAQHVREVAAQMRPLVAPGTPVVACSKGIERKSCEFMPEVLAAALPEAVVAVLSGPSFAREIAADLPCAVGLGCTDARVRARLARAIANPRFCVHPSEDAIGVAIGGVMKNVVGIASGITAGRKLGENARSTLVTLGLAETVRLGLAKGARAETFMGVAGIGDLMLSANSMQSRNTSLGFALGEGRKLAEVLAGRREVTEGAFSTEAVAALARTLGVDMPITFAIDDVLNRSADLDGAMARLMAHLAAGAPAMPD
ncbi:MAG: NAD(P)-dependent glycerol-3-phosphate dehydrogenase [Burkholderiales bacterium]|jgi:glycerol-3-phosphate dehydrogenase (NAD(P)+)|nr:NAD(P)-dependent glycerol-3-phosphate dehydrogenase [Burkholderiales bacterium]